MTARTFALAFLVANLGHACTRNDEPDFRPEPETRTEAEQAPARTKVVPTAPQAEPGSIPAPADVAAPPTDAQRTPTGLASKVIAPGTGTAHPMATSRVRVHYTGWQTNGEMFDSSVARGEPTEFPLNGVIAGWTEGVQLMVVGEKRRFWIPENLAYGGRPGAPSGMLVFDVELLAIL